jgi:two-component system chemotaxis response regulator CheB
MARLMPSDPRLLRAEARLKNRTDPVPLELKNRTDDMTVAPHLQPGNYARSNIPGTIMPDRDIVVIGASAGGVEAVSTLVAGLPASFPAAVFIVLHIAPHNRSYLPDILRKRGALPVHHARPGEPIRTGQIYIAPPDYHLLLRPGHVELSQAARENHHRPAIDVLFRSAARAYGPRVIGLVLTGWLNDGTAGLLAIRHAGGVAVIQDPFEAEAAAMPASAREIAGADHVVKLAAMPALLKDLVTSGVRRGVGEAAMPDPIEKMPERVARDMNDQERGLRQGQVSVFTCPECGGNMWQVDDPEVTRFRCHTGHAYYGVDLLGEQSEALEAALWTAVRIFKEKRVLAEQMALQARQRGNSERAERFQDEARLANKYGDLIQHSILQAPLAELPNGPNGPPSRKQEESTAEADQSP